MIHYIICLATIFFVQTFCARQYDGHFSVVPQNRPRDNNLGRYASRAGPYANPFFQKLCSERAESWALHEEAQLLLRQQASWEVLPPDCVENFRGMSLWESHMWGHGRDDYAARWNAVSAPVHMILHPRETIHHLAQSLAQLIHFLPPAYEHFDNLTQHSNSLELYEAECDRIAHNWGLACDQVTGPLLVQLATAVLVTTLTNSVIARCAPALVGALAQRGAAVAQAVGVRYPLAAYLTHAAVRTYAATAKAVKRGVKVTAARVERLLTHYMRIPESAPLLATAEGVIIPGGDMRNPRAQHILLFSESIAELPRRNIIRGSAAVEEAAAIIPAHHGLLTTSAEVAAEMQRIKSVPYEVLVDRITETGVQLGYSRASIMQALENFKNPKVNVTIDMFGEGIFRFRNIPGAEEVIHNVLKSMLEVDNYKQANGALYELSAPVMLEIIDYEKILALTNYINVHEYDFITPLYLGECKNIFLHHFIGKPALMKNKIDTLMKQFENLAKNARSISKQPMLLTKHPIPEEFQSIKQLIFDLNISCRIGY